MLDAVAHEGAGHRALLQGTDPDGAREAYRAAVAAYRASWEAAPPDAYGRLVGMLKAGVLAGSSEEDAVYVRHAVGDEAAGESAAAAYARAIAALVAGEDDEAVRWAAAMRGGSDAAFERTASAIDALGRGDGDAYRVALLGIVRDFEAREEHLTGVPFADTAAMLELLAAPRGLAARPASGVLPPRR